MVRLNRAGLKDIGINGTLREESDAFKLTGFFLKYTDKFCADDFAFAFRLCHTGKLVQETVNCIDIDQICIHLVAENLDYLLWFSLAQQAVIDMHTGQPVPYGADQQGGDDRRIDPAGQRKQNLSVADLGVERIKLLLDKRIGQLRRRNALHGFRTFFRHGFTLQIIVIW